MTELPPIGRTPTGIKGFDQVALGGLPAGRSTLVTGTTGSGKTLLALQFLASGITSYDEPGVFVTFEETADDLRRNTASLGLALGEWEAQDKWVFVDASEDLEETVIVGSYDFGALVARVEHAVRRIGARRLSIDSLGAILTRFADAGAIRHGLFRLAASLESLGVTSVITAERTSEHDGLSRYGVEDFVLDNVIVLRNVLAGERRRRTVEVVKFRGAPHRSGEWLFTIDPEEGMVVIPLAFLAPRAHASDVQVSSGNAELDQMCGGGWYRDAIVLLTGPTGSGKTLSGLRFAAAGVSAGERCLLCSFEESREQLGRSAAGWGLDLGAMEASGLLRVICDYPEVASLEDHFLRLRRAIEDFRPSRLIVDTLSALERLTTPRSMLDFVLSLGGLIRQNDITALFAAAPYSPTTPTSAVATEIASITDVSIALQYVERAGEIRRIIAVIQTRGSAHDQRLRQVDIDANGMHIGEPWPGTAGLLAPGSTIGPIAPGAQSGTGEGIPG